MSAVQKIVIRILAYAAKHFQSVQTGLIDLLRQIRAAFERETTEAYEMLETYNRFRQGRASVDEMRRANHQFRGLLKSLGFGVLLVLPFSPITLPVVIKLGQILGVDIVPKSFRDGREKSEKSGPQI